MTPLSDIRTWSFFFATENTRVVVQPVKLGLLADEFFSSRLDGEEVGQVELEEENGLVPRLLPQLIDRLFRLFL